MKGAVHFISLNGLSLSIADTDSGKKVRRARVTFSYAADNADELALQPGQVRLIKTSLRCKMLILHIMLLSSGGSTYTGSDVQWRKINS